MRVIDFHAHAFPDALAERAMPMLEAEGNVKAALDGKISSLLMSMDEAGIEVSVVQSIATKPKQFEPIVEWSKQIASDRLIPFPSVHPADPAAAEHVRRVHEEGFLGIKLHPYYQQFRLDEERVFPIYEEAGRRGLILFVHTGFDMAYPRDRLCDPERIVKVLNAFPDLLFVTTHLGAWEDWDEVRRLLLGRPIYMEASYSVHVMGKAQARDVMLNHPVDRLIFGSDSPWRGQRESIEDIRSLGLGDGIERAVFSENASRLLRLK
jgi:predicted TIM-barrel fold metal-dependent hydrolase